SSLSLPMEMLTAADQLARADKRHRDTLQLSVVGSGGDAIRTASGLRLQPDGDWRETLTTDLLILPALWRSPLVHLRRYPQLLPWLRHHASQQTLLCAVGTSSVFIAEAGLLDGRPATTHRFSFDLFEQRYPQAPLKRHHLITGDGNLFCAGSVNSVADLTIHFIERLYDRALAHQVEAQFSPEIRRPFESHAYSAELHSDEVVVQAQELMRARYAEPIR